MPIRILKIYIDLIKRISLINNVCKDFDSIAQNFISISENFSYMVEFRESVHISG